MVFSKKYVSDSRKYVRSFKIRGKKSIFSKVAS